MLKAYSDKFNGVKMFETDHVQADKSTRTWVSTIESIKGFTADGAPIARVAVIDDGFASKLKNLQAANMLSSMECSILASGSVRPYEAGGRKGKYVEAISDVSSVDWVTRAGAGGRVLNVSESFVHENDSKEIFIPTTDDSSIHIIPVEVAPVIENAPPKPTEPLCMEAGAVMAVLSETHLPTVSRERLSKMQWTTANELTQAIEREVAYIKELTGSGRPSNLGATTVKTVSMQEVEQNKNSIVEKYLGGK
jgi:hypothetical protein